MSLIRAFLLAALVFATSTLSVQSAAEDVELYLLSPIDAILNHYCIDVNGPPTGMQLDTPLQVHTCYSYQGELTADQLMHSEDIDSGKIRIVSVDMCAQLDGAEPGDTISLTECTEIEEQSFSLEDNGHIV
jgi:hypothetical protein